MPVRILRTAASMVAALAATAVLMPGAASADSGGGTVGTKWDPTEFCDFYEAMEQEAEQDRDEALENEDYVGAQHYENKAKGWQNLEKGAGCPGAGDAGPSKPATPSIADLEQMLDWSTVPVIDAELRAMIAAPRLP